jgi:hypothetical protein
MPNLSDVVFAVTPKGFAAMRNDDASVPLELKTVLTMVDGLCPVAQYEPFLRVFAPLADKFHLLEQQGYLRRTGTVSGFAVKIFNESAQSGQPLSKMPRIDSEHANSGFAPFS